MHLYDPETKRQTMESHHKRIPATKKFWTQPSDGKVTATVFWDSEGLPHVNFMPKGATINSERYKETLKKLQSCIKRIRPGRDIQEVLLLHDNARPHTSLHTQDRCPSSCIQSKSCTLGLSFVWSNEGQLTRTTF